MKKNHKNFRRGFSSIETAIAGTLLTIALLGISGVLSECQRSWNALYNRTYSDVVTNGYVVKRMFDAAIRKSSTTGLQVDGSGRWVEVNYYQDDTSEALDAYARFYCSGNTLYVEYGRLNPKEPLSTHTVCANVANCVFKQSGSSVHMLLTLNNGSQRLTVGSSAKLHN